MLLSLLSRGVERCHLACAHAVITATAGSGEGLLCMGMMLLSPSVARGCSRWRLLLRVNVAGTSWGAHNDCAVWTGLDSITYWKEGVESIDEVRMSVEQLRNSFDYTRRVNPVICLSILELNGGRVTCQGQTDNVSHNRKMTSRKRENTNAWVLKSFIMSKKRLYTSD